MRNRADLFLGQWTVARTVRHRDGTTAVFDGVAIITQDWFEETGESRMGGFRLQSSRRYGLLFSPDGVEVRFADARPFVRIGMGAAQHIRHLCGEDDYRGRYYFPYDDMWIEAWEVVGPRKSYRSIARYTRS